MPEEADVADATGTADTGTGDLTAVSEPPHESAAAPAQSAERAPARGKVFILPLGTGLVLVGLGLGLGLFALRVRRG